MVVEHMKQVEVVLVVIELPLQKDLVDLPHLLKLNSLLLPKHIQLLLVLGEMVELQEPNQLQLLEVVEEYQHSLP